MDNSTPENKKQKKTDSSRKTSKTKSKTSQAKDTKNPSATTEHSTSNGETEGPVNSIDNEEETDTQLDAPTKKITPEMDDWISALESDKT